MCRDPIPVRLSRLLAAGMVALSLSLPVQGPGHAEMVGHAGTAGMARPAGMVDATAESRSGDPGAPGPDHGQHLPGDGAVAESDAAPPAPTGEGAPTCHCCPGPCACPPALALDGRVVRVADARDARPDAVPDAPSAGPACAPIPHALPFSTAPPPTLG